MSTAAARIPKAERTRRQILAAAERRFAEAGFENTRLDDIADDIGMVGSAILYHFADKRELYRAVRDDLAADLFAEVEHAVAGKAPPRQRLVALVRASARAIATRPGLAGIALREAMSSDSGVERRTNPLLGRIVALFEEGVRTGDIQAVGNEPYHLLQCRSGHDPLLRGGAAALRRRPARGSPLRRAHGDARERRRRDRGASTRHQRARPV